MDRTSYRKENGKVVESDGYQDENVWDGVCLSLKGEIFNAEQQSEENFEGDVVPNGACQSSGGGFVCEDACTIIGPGTVSNAVYKFFINGRTGNALSNNEDDTFVKRITCPKQGNGQDGVCSDGRCIPCDNDGFCEPAGGEDAVGCCDCRPCNDACRKDANSCQGGAAIGTNGCGWCYVPTLKQPWVHARPAGTKEGIGGMDYPYLLPGVNYTDEGVTSNTLDYMACVNVTSGDPFNCGGCGFVKDDCEKDEGTPPVCKIDDYNIEPDDDFNCFTSQYAKPFTPYCSKVNNKMTCVGVGERNSPSVWAKSTADVSPFFYYDVVAEGAGFKSVPKVNGVEGGAETQLAYQKGQFDDDEEACSYTGGSFLDEGCCGSGKLRFSGPNCQIKRICDGSDWHNASDEEQQGEVFKLDVNYRGSHYPIASVGGIFSACVDEEQYDSVYLQRLGSESEFCVPGLEQEPRVSFLDMDYLCPSNQYFARGNHIIDIMRLFCRSDHLVDYNLAFEGQTGTFICGAESRADPASMWGQAYLIDAGRDFPFGGENDDDDKLKGDLNRDSARCPSAINGPLYNVNNVELNVLKTIGCPGSVPITEPVSLPMYAGPFGSTANRNAFVCLTKNPEYPLPEESNFNINSFYIYDGSGTPMGSVKNHSYMCFTDKSKPEPEELALPKRWDSSRAFIGICCGNRSNGCSDITGSIDGSFGKEIRAGQYYNTSGGPVYCLADGRWAFDLDSRELQATCKAATFSPTGEFCCSEADDKKYFESYNDVGGSGACFLGRYRANNQNVIFNTINITSNKNYSIVYPNLYVYNGSVLGCGFSDSDFVIPDINRSLNITLGLDSNFSGVDVAYFSSHLGEIEDWPNPGGGGNRSVAELFRTGRPLVKSADYCRYLNDSEQGMFCSLNDSWVSAKGYVIHKSVVPVRLLGYMDNQTDVNISSFGCCKKSECWDPLVDGCIASQLAYSEGYRISNNSFFKCLNGGWVDILGGEKLTPNRCYSGFCPEAGQCLFDLFGDSADNGNPDGNPQCLNDKQYKGVFVCANGSWDSRTRLLALKLAGLVVSGDDYSLSCGSVDDTLVLAQNPGLSDVFCTLKSGDKRVLGVLLNQPLIASNYSGFVDALRQSFWLAYPGSGATFDTTKNCTSSSSNFSECLYAYATTPPKDLLRFYYDKPYSMAVISTGPSSLGEKICSVLPGWLQWLCPKEPVMVQLLKNAGGVEKIYFAGSGSKSVFGFGKNICPDPAQGLAWDYSFNYAGFGSGVVDVLKQGIIAESLNSSNSSIKAWNARGDAWNSLSLLKYE